MTLREVGWTMPVQSKDMRVLMYSHDTFGLGHLRRCLTIANHLVETFDGVHVLIITGAATAGAYDYRSRVDFEKIPSVVKLRNGDYTVLTKHLDFEKTLAMRRKIIRQTAEAFQPDIFIVDKEPLGLRREVEDTLSYLRGRGSRLVLGLRDVMDAPHLLDLEWKRHDVIRKIDRYYDDIWVYGPPEFHDPLLGLDVPATMRKKMNFVGFLQRRASSCPDMDKERCDYILVTPGGGGDGTRLVRDFINAYRFDCGLTQKAVIVLGPYMPSDQRNELSEAAGPISALNVIEFDNRMENLIAGARAVVAMGGYNTFCEILSFDKPALIIPRTAPRQEQLIRTRRASELGLVDMLDPREALDGKQVSQAIWGLLKRPPPSAATAPFGLDGLSNISTVFGQWRDQRNSTVMVDQRRNVPA